jgi:hypothetical protein
MHGRTGATKRRSMGPRPRRSGGAVPTRSESKRSRDAALERHWGNLF